jgi:hypothetical protein
LGGCSSTSAYRHAETVNREDNMNRWLTLNDLPIGEDHDAR